MIPERLCISLVGADQAYSDDMWTVTLMILTLPYCFNGFAEHLVQQQSQPHLLSAEGIQHGIGGVVYVYQPEAGEGTMPDSGPLLRYWNPTISDHFYTTDYGELGAGAEGYTDEGAACYVYTGEGADLVPLYRYWSPSGTDHFYTTNWAELGEGANGYAFERIACYVWTDASQGGVPLYRYWNPVRTDHFYTTDYGELGAAADGWHLESIQCFVIQAEQL